MPVEVIFTLNNSVVFTRKHDEKALKHIAEKYKLDGDDPSVWAIRVTEMYLDAEGIDNEREGIIRIQYVSD